MAAVLIQVDGRTDMTKLMSAFRDSANARQNCFQLYVAYWVLPEQVPPALTQWRYKQKKVKTRFSSMFPDSLNTIALWNDARLRPFVLLVGATCRWRWVRSKVEFWQENPRSVLRKTWPGVTLSTINLRWTDLGLNPGLRETNINPQYTVRIPFVPHTEHCAPTVHTSVFTV